MGGPWPDGMARIPDARWTRGPVPDRARAYDAVTGHGWYENLDPTVEAVLEATDPGDLVVDYATGTGVLPRRLLEAGLPGGAGILGVDASRSFLRLAVEALGGRPEVALRHLAYREDESRLERLDEATPEPLAGALDGLVSANALHLYQDLPETVAAWTRVLAPGAWVHLQSGNVGPADALPDDAWIIDETVAAVEEAARAVVREDPDLARHRKALDDPERMEAHEAVRDRFFPPVRDLGTYRSILEEQGIVVEEIQRRTVPVDVEEWRSFLATYADGFLGWIGGTERVEGEPPSEEDLAHRREVLDRAVDRVLEGPTFEACWTYLSCRSPG